MPIFLELGGSDGGGTSTRVLDDASASGGGYAAGNHTKIITSDTAWDLSGCTSLTLTWQNDMSVNYWTNPQGSVANGTRCSYIVFADDSELRLGTGVAAQTTTVDLSAYTDTQKASVRLRGKLDYYLSTVTNAASYGGITATNVSAVASGAPGMVTAEIGKLYEFGAGTLSQIAKVYDWDGTANSLIYNAETVLYDGGMVIPFEDFGYVSNGTYVYTTRTDNGTNLFAKTHYNIGGNDFYEGYAGWRAQQIIDLSQYSAISIKARVQTYWNSYCGVKIEFWDADNKSVGSIDIQKDVSSTNDSEWTFDLSAFNDACKVGVTAWQTYSNGRGAEFNLYKMVLT